MIRSNDVDFCETIEKNKLKIFTSMLVTEKVAVKDKEVVARADHDLLSRFLLIWEKHEMTMRGILRYSLGSVTWALAIPFGNV